MTEDFASIVSYVMNTVGKSNGAQDYYENIKDGFKLPALYFKIPDATPNKDILLPQYVNSKSAFIEVYHLSNDLAYTLANDIANSIFKNRGYIPLLNEDGKETGLFIRVKVNKVSRIDDCVAQVQLSWEYRQHFADTSKMYADNLNFNLTGG